MPSISAAEAACRTSRPPLKEVELRELEWGLDIDLELERESRGMSGSPRSMKTSQTRSWAGKGIL